MTLFSFTSHLLAWHRAHPRPLPWDGGPRDAYHIWISEIVMQQTRIEQGAEYYQRFVSRFPDVHSLASASADDVLRYWQGLGYYTRARNLHAAARYIVMDLGGRFPDTYEGLLAMPGVGPYSAAAIASFAYALPYPVVDGNVKRVVARFAGLTASVDLPVTHAVIRDLAASWMKGAPPGEFNQAIMNFGALVCKPKGALCTTCLLSKRCYAFRQDQVDTLPVRSKTKTSTLRHLHFIVFEYRGKRLLVRREGKDIWRGLYAPPVLETLSDRIPADKKIRELAETLLRHAEIERYESSEIIEQILSHQVLRGRFHYVRVLSSPKNRGDDGVWVGQKTKGSYGLPKMVLGRV